jgi:hypothetical protein
VISIFKNTPAYLGGIKDIVILRPRAPVDDDADCDDNWEDE